MFLVVRSPRIRPNHRALHVQETRESDSRQRARDALNRNNKSPAAFPLIRHVWGAMAMAKDPIPIPEPDVVRPPTPSEAPTPDVVNIPEPAPDWEPSPLPSIIPPGFPEEVPKEAPPAGRGRPAQRERRRPRAHAGRTRPSNLALIRLVDEDIRLWKGPSVIRSAGRGGAGCA